MTIRVKATEQYFLVVLCEVIPTFESGDEILSVTLQMKASEQYFPVVLFIMLYKVVLTFETVNEIPKCVHSNKKLLLNTTSWLYNVQGGLALRCR